jgi:pimeloyl-ACP methyl ester carboxylesterase
VLDWGGSGRPILLLAGLGDTAHVFDDFAPLLTERHHVYGMTRRGFGDSSAPESGYDFDRPAADVIAVIDSLRIEAPIIVGHSFAGEEMHILGSRHASQVAALVYIEAAFNRALDIPEYDAKARELPRAPTPDVSDRGSIAALRDFATRHGLPSYPEAEMRNRYVVDAEGRISDSRTPAPAVRDGISGAMRAVMEGYDPPPIAVPALAIYAVPAQSQDLMRSWYDRDDPVILQTIEELFALARERYRQHAEWFESRADGTSRVVGVAGEHHLFVTSPARVKEEIDAFAASLD